MAGDEKSVNDLNLADVQKMIGTFRAVINKLKGVGDDTGLIDELHQANILLEKTVLDIDGSADGLKSAVEIVENFKKNFSAISGELTDFKDIFEQHRLEIKELNSMNTSQLVKYMDEFVEDIKKIGDEHLYQTRISNTAVKQTSFRSLIAGAIGLIIGTVAFTFAFLFFLYNDELQVFKLIKKTKVQIITTNQGVVFSVDSTRAKIDLRKGKYNMAVTF